MEPDILSFAPEVQTPSPNSQSVWKVLIADDEPSVHLVTKLALGDFIFEGRRLELLSAYGEDDVRSLLVQNPDIALILLDVVMDTSTSGFDLVRYIRNELGNKNVRIIMRTGQSGSSPEDSVIINYDINDFKDKTELTVAKLRTTLISSLRTYNHLQIIATEQAKLAQSKAYLRDILNGLETVLITVDSQLKVGVWNHPAEVWSGISSEKAVGQELFAVAPWLAPLGSLFQEVLSSGRRDSRRDVPISLPTAPGFVRMSVHPLVTPGGQEMVIHLEDVTISHRHEEQALRHERMGVFSTLAEGFGSELQAIIAELKTELPTFAQGIVRLEALTRRLPVSLPSTPSPRRALDWNQFIHDLAPKSPAQIYFALQPEPVLVWSSENELHDICSRIFDASAEGTVIKIFFDRTNPGDLPLRLLSEADNRRFWRLRAEVHPSDSEQTQLWSIDLTSVYNITEALGGFVDVVPQAQEGFTVYVWLPEPPSPEQGLRTPVWQDTGLILVCDDETMMLQVASSILKRFGYSVLTAPDGHSALSIIGEKKSALKLVILDLLLPGMSGLEIFRQIRKIAPDLPVLLSSGFGRGDSVDSALTEGVTGFLQKPFGLEKLAKTLQSLFASAEVKKIPPQSSKEFS